MEKAKHPFGEHSSLTKPSILLTLLFDIDRKAQKPNFELVHTFLPHSNWTTISQFCPSSNPAAINDILFATGSSDGTVKLFQFQGNPDNVPVIIKRHGGQVISLPH